MAAESISDDCLSRLYVSRVVQREESGDPPLEYSDEEFRGRFGDVELVFGSSTGQGHGSLYITTKRVVWLSSGSESNGFAVDFPNIVMHAISKDECLSASSCVYLQLETSEDPPSEEDEADPIDPGLKLIHAQDDVVEEIFRTMSECASLNPDPEANDDDEENASFFYDVESALANADPEAIEAWENVHITVAEGDLDELVGNDPERFEDAESEEGDDVRMENGIGH